ncbi:MAG TPA: ornithine cyclodeaminase family protein [Stellaceae bacterium]|nr:ornithine cyclodeaminase family protein [Stellaceae bacterium]
MTDGTGLLVIDRETVRRLLPMEDCIKLMRRAMAALSTGGTRQLLRQILDLGGGNLFGIMPGAMEEAFGAKLISIFPENFAKGIQSHQGLVALFHPATGAPAAILHAGEITAIRTAAASAAATDALARSEAARLAIIGYGEQAHAHAVAMTKVRAISEIRIWGRSLDRAAALAAQLGAELGLTALAAPTAHEAAAGADIICTVTGAVEPILDNAWVADGTHINLVGSSRAGPREIGDDLVCRARFIADHRDGVLRQGAEFLHAKAAGLIGDDHVVAEIGEVFAGVKPGRISAADVTIYKSLGSIVQDLASAWHVVAEAEKRGLGVRVGI